MKQELNFKSYDMKLMKGDEIILGADNIKPIGLYTASNNTEPKKVLTITKPSGSTITINPEDIKKVKYNEKGVIEEIDCGSFVLTLNSDKMLQSAIEDLLK